VVDDDLRQDCEVLGLDVDQLIEPIEQQAAPTNYELWPEHAQAWALYQACETQWRMVIGMDGAVWLGLDMPGVDVIRKAHRISDEDWTEVLWQLQVMEAEGKKIRNARIASES